MKNKKGFTLIELIVVIIVIGVLVLLAAPKFLGYTEKAKLTQIQNDVKAMENSVEVYLSNSDNRFDNWTDSDKDLNEIAAGGKLFEVSGLVEEVDTSKNYKIVPDEIKNKVNTKLTGAFYSDDSAKVYYESDKTLGGENKDNGIYTEEEIEDLVNNEGYIKVKNAEDLNNVRNKLNAKYIQVANINLSSFDNFDPIGPFTGIYNGGGFKINNLTIDKPTTNYVGLFKQVQSNAMIENVGLNNVNVIGSGSTGTLIGISDLSTIKNSYVTGKVIGKDSKIGGLIGITNSSKVINSHSDVLVEHSGSFYAGGLIGESNLSTIENSHSIGNIKGLHTVGGLVGEGSYTTIKKSFSTGEIYGIGHDVGGLAGKFSGTIDDSYSSSNVIAKGFYVGGLIGEVGGYYSNENAIINNSYSTGLINGDFNVGGLIGFTTKKAVINNSYAIGETKGTGSSIGGLIGEVRSEVLISNSYSKSNVTGNKQTGGLLGLVNLSESSTPKPSIKNSFATGLITGNLEKGGLIGEDVYSTGATIINSYWDKETTGQSTSVGSPDTDGKTTAEMKTKSTYIDWDFINNWKMKNGDYPQLKWEK